MIRSTGTPTEPSESRPWQVGGGPGSTGQRALPGWWGARRAGLPLSAHGSFVGTRWRLSDVC